MTIFNLFIKYKYWFIYLLIDNNTVFQNLDNTVTKQLNDNYYEYFP